MRIALRKLYSMKTEGERNRWIRVVLKVKSIRHGYKMDVEDDMDSMMSSTSSGLKVSVDGDVASDMK